MCGEATRDETGRETTQQQSQPWSPSCHQQGSVLQPSAKKTNLTPSACQKHVLTKHVIKERAATGRACAHATQTLCLPRLPSCGRKNAVASPWPASLVARRVCLLAPSRIQGQSRRQLRNCRLELQLRLRLQLVVVVPAPPDPKRPTSPVPGDPPSKENPQNCSQA